MASLDASLTQIHFMPTQQADSSIAEAQRKREENKADDSGMTRADAGHLGGIKTREKYGSDHYRRIGRAGGKARGGA